LYRIFKLWRTAIYLGTVKLLGPWIKKQIQFQLRRWPFNGYTLYIRRKSICTPRDPLVTSERICLLQCLLFTFLPYFFVCLSLFASFTTNRIEGVVAYTTLVKKRPERLQRFLISRKAALISRHLNENSVMKSNKELN
jgi:hypothetical protein